MLDGVTFIIASARGQFDVVQIDAEWGEGYPAVRSAFDEIEVKIGGEDIIGLDIVHGSRYYDRVKA